jgi:hypothetical protein
MSDGQLAVNTEATSPGVFFKNTSGLLVKAGPVHVGTTAPNATPASGGDTGNSVGEQWLDTSVSPSQLKTWDGSAWVSDFPDEIPVSKLADGTARQLLQTDAAGTGVEWTSNVDIPGTLDVSGAATFDDTATFANNAAHPIGSAAAPTITFTGDTNTGIYSPGADQVAISTNGTGRLFVDSVGLVGIRKAVPTALCDAVGSVVGFRHTNGSGTSEFYSDSAQTVINSSGSIVASASGANSFVVQTNSSERLRVDSSGRLGLGTSSPANLLDLFGTDCKLRVRDSGQTNGLEIYQTNSDGGNSIYAVNNNYLRFGTNNTERVRITSGGNVGIGTASPQDTLHVAGSVYTENRLYAGDGAAATPSIRFWNSNVGLYAPGSNALGFSTGGSERARIDSSGRLLVGTSSARQIGTERGLQVESTGALGSVSVARNDNSSASASPVIVLGRSRGTTNGSNTVVQADDDLGYLIFAGADGSDMNSYGAWIRCQVDGTPGDNDMPGRLVFSTTADGSASPTERMRISQNGVVTVKNGAVAEIGTLTDAATITPNFAANCNFTVTLGGNRTIANPTNLTAGQSGSIFIVQDGTGSRTLAWGSYWDFAGGTAPTLSTAGGSVDRVDYIVRSSTSIHTVFTANYS